MAQAVPPTTALCALPTWRMVDFISDTHLHAGELPTFLAWQHYMLSTPANAVFILGDLFEVWVGDDVLQDGGFQAQCARVIRQTSARCPVFFMHGNRDFLAGNGLMAACNATLLADPSVLVFNNQRWLLSHGDALCLGDKAYMAFRQRVRSTAWQQNFLAQPLVNRQAIAHGLRQQSQVSKQSSTQYADVDTCAARQLLQDAQALTLIHGHTHQPAMHDLGGGLRRIVLSDWHVTAHAAAKLASAPRAEVLRLTHLGIERVRL